MEERVHALQKQVELHQLERQYAEQMVATLQREAVPLASSAPDLSHLQQELTEAKAAHQSAINDLSQMREKARAAIQSLKDRLALAESKVVESASALVDRDTALARAEEYRLLLETELAKGLELHKQLDRSTADFAQARREWERQTLQIREEQAAALQAATSAQAELETLRNQTQQYLQAARAKVAAAQEISSQLSAAQQRIQALEAELKATRDSESGLREMHNQLMGTQAHAGELEEQLRAAQEKHNQEIESLNSKWQQALKQLDESLEEKTAAVQNLEAQILAANSTIHGLETEFASKQAKAQAQPEDTDRLLELEEALQVEQTLHVGAVRERDALKEQLLQQSEIVAQQQRELADARWQLQALPQTLKAKEEDLHEVHKRYAAQELQFVWASQQSDRWEIAAEFQETVAACALEALATLRSNTQPACSEGLEERVREIMALLSTDGDLVGEFVNELLAARSELHQLQLVNHRGELEYLRDEVEGLRSQLRFCKHSLNSARLVVGQFSQAVRGDRSQIGELLALQQALLENTKNSCAQAVEQYLSDSAQTQTHLSTLLETKSMEVLLAEQEVARCNILVQEAGEWSQTVGRVSEFTTTAQPADVAMKDISVTPTQPEIIETPSTDARSTWNLDLQFGPQGQIDGKANSRKFGLLAVRRAESCWAVRTDSGSSVVEIVLAVERT
eukprot:TRINITY_DN7451_c0_g1_i3.p1 TRINITY_DN7451_c0_g1~~TRINITY_DN7451_c0_g1_i3.p1  ORF type:complete len:685 (-),score=153.27 TRINITY_DN7451_c0_g1_i3:27-2081(-)